MGDSSCGSIVAGGHVTDFQAIRERDAFQSEETVRKQSRRSKNSASVNLPNGNFGNGRVAEYSPVPLQRRRSHSEWRRRPLSGTSAPYCIGIPQSDPDFRRITKRLTTLAASSVRRVLAPPERHSAACRSSRSGARFPPRTFRQGETHPREATRPNPASMCLVGLMPVIQRNRSKFVAQAPPSRTWNLAELAASPNSS